MCFGLALVVAVGGGFMGVQQFSPTERSIDIGQPSAVVTAVMAKASGAAEFAESEGQNSGFSVDGKAAVLMDAGSGAVLFAQNAREELPPASVTKIMTMLLILEAVDKGQLSLSDTVTVSERAASMGGSQMYMEPGEQHTLDEIMTGIAMVSANDACITAAELHSGTVEIFVENMNKRAKELGMENTNFVNTNGLPVANHYTSAYDIALMSKELLQYTGDHDWFTTWQKTISVGLPGKETEFGLTNTNRLLKQYPGTTGLKTGFTQEAGYCFAGSAVKEDMTLIAVILGSPSSQIRFAEAAKMLDYGFAMYDSVLVAKNGDPIGAVEIQKGTPSVINAAAGEEISILVKKGDAETITVEQELYTKLRAPIEKGQQIGELVIKQNDAEIDRYPLVAEEAVKQASIKDLYIHLMKNLI